MSRTPKPRGTQSLLRQTRTIRCRARIAWTPWRERRIQGIAVGAGLQLVPSMVVASIALLASTITEHKFSPLNLLVLVLDDVTYLFEGYLLLVGTQRYYGRVITFSSLERKWNLYLDHDVSSYVTYGNLIAGAVAQPFAALVVARAM